jgi:RNA polymerase sigma-70 factor, ECF subfamily
VLPDPLTATGDLPRCLFRARMTRTARKESARLAALQPPTIVVRPARCSTLPVNSPRSYSEADDPQLLAWSANGDRRAFDEIVGRHGPFALRVAMRLLSDPAAAEDVVQEAMVRAWSQCGQFDPRRARFTTWLYRIVMNLCIDQRRRMQPESMPENFDPADPAMAADEGLERRERHAVLAGALRDLPVRQRAAMTLVYDEGLSGAEAARVLGLSAKAVERLLARGRAYLRARLHAHDLEENRK